MARIVVGIIDLVFLFDRILGSTIGRSYVMLFASLAANVLILVPVLAALWNNTPGMEAAFGSDTTARRILACVYLSIAFCSVAITIAGAFSISDWRAWAIALIAVQIVYKSATVFVVGPGNPVVITNIAMIILHSITLASVYFSKG